MDNRIARVRLIRATHFPLRKKFCGIHPKVSLSSSTSGLFLLNSCNSRTPGTPDLVRCFTGSNVIPIDMNEFDQIIEGIAGKESFPERQWPGVLDIVSGVT